MIRAGLKVLAHSIWFNQDDWVAGDCINLRGRNHPYGGQLSPSLESAKRVDDAERPKSGSPAEQILSHPEKSSQIAVPMGQGEKLDQASGTSRFLNGRDSVLL